MKVMTVPDRLVELLSRKRGRPVATLATEQPTTGPRYTAHSHIFVFILIFFSFFFNPSNPFEPSVLGNFTRANFNKHALESVFFLTKISARV
jgi:hypothetical protein